MTNICLNIFLTFLRKSVLSGAIHSIKRYFTVHYYLIPKEERQKNYDLCKSLQHLSVGAALKMPIGRDVFHSRVSNKNSILKGNLKKKSSDKSFRSQFVLNKVKFYF